MQRFKGSGGLKEGHNAEFGVATVRDKDSESRPGAAFSNSLRKQPVKRICAVADKFHAASPEPSTWIFWQFMLELELPCRRTAKLASSSCDQACPVWCSLFLVPVLQSGCSDHETRCQHFESFVPPCPCCGCRKLTSDSGGVQKECLSQQVATPAERAPSP